MGRVTMGVHDRTCFSLLKLLKSSLKRHLWNRFCCWRNGGLSITKQHNPKSSCFPFHSSIFLLLMSHIDSFNVLRDKSLSLALAGGRKWRLITSPQHTHWQIQKVNWGLENTHPPVPCASPMETCRTHRCMCVSPWARLKPGISEQEYLLLGAHGQCKNNGPKPQGQLQICS